MSEAVEAIIGTVALRRPSQQDVNWVSSFAAGAQVQEERQPLPAAPSFRGDVVIWNARLPEGLYGETSLLQREGIALKRTMLAMEGHGQSVTLLDVRVPERLEVITLDHEVSICAFRFEMAGRIDRVDNRQTKTAARFENASNFAHRCRHCVDVVKRHKG